MRKNRCNKITYFFGQNHKNDRRRKTFYKYLGKSHSVAESKAHNRIGNHKRYYAGKFADSRKQSCHKSAKCVSSADKALISACNTEYCSRCNSADRTACNTTVSCTKQGNKNGKYSADRNALNGNTAER